MLTLALFAAFQTAAAPSPPPDGRTTQAMAAAAAIRLHRRMDANRDGYVTPQEMRDFVVAAMNGLPMPGTDATHPLPTLSARLFAAADTDHDGRISQAEAVAQAQRDFAIADADHDGIVTPEERMALLQKEIDGNRTVDGVPLIVAPKP